MVENAIAELFGLEAVNLVEPRRPIVGRYRGPKMDLSAKDGAVLGHLVERGKHAYAYTLQDLAAQPLLRIDRISKASAARLVFRLADGQDRPLGEVRTRGSVVRTRQLEVRAEAGTLRLTRNAPMRGTWLVRDDADDQLGLIRASAARSLADIQRYAVELDQRTGPEQRRLILAAVVCLQVVRRWSGNGDQ